MKSLEIVNELIYKCNDFLGDCITCASKENLQTIKQDLEVLEIIKNKQVNISYLKQYFDDKRFTDEDIFYLTTLNNMRLTMEELLKLKQWLEENENE